MMARTAPQIGISGSSCPFTPKTWTIHWWARWVGASGDQDLTSGWVARRETSSLSEV